MKNEKVIENLRSVRYFLEEKEVTDYVNWEECKDSVLERCTLLGIYLQKQKEADALKKAALEELNDVIWELEDED